MSLEDELEKKTNELGRYKRIWTACWAFGLILGTLSLLLSVLDNIYWILPSIFFWILHVVSIIRTNYDPLGWVDDPNVKSR